MSLTMKPFAVVLFAVRRLQDAETMPEIVRKLALVYARV